MNIAPNWSAIFSINDGRYSNTSSHLVGLAGVLQAVTYINVNVSLFVKIHTQPAKDDCSCAYIHIGWLHSLYFRSCLSRMDLLRILCQGHQCFVTFGNVRRNYKLFYSTAYTYSSCNPAFPQLLPTQQRPSVNVFERNSFAVIFALRLPTGTRLIWLLDILLQYVGDFFNLTRC